MLVVCYGGPLHWQNAALLGWILTSLMRASRLTPSDCSNVEECVIIVASPTRHTHTQTAKWVNYGWVVALGLSGLFQLFPTISIHFHPFPTFWSCICWLKPFEGSRLVVSFETWTTCAGDLSGFLPQDSSQRGFRGHEGSPIAGWFLLGKIPSKSLKWMMTGGTPMTMETSKWICNDIYAV